MAFGTVIKSVSATSFGFGGTIGSANGFEHNGRHLTAFTGDAFNPTIVYALKTGASNKVCKGYSGDLLSPLHAKQAEGQARSYGYDSIAGDNKQWRTVGPKATASRTGGPAFSFTRIDGRRTSLGGTNGNFYEHINRAVLRGPPSTGLTSPVNYTMGLRYTYVLHNTTKLVKMDRRNGVIVNSCTLPGAGGVAGDGIFHDGRNLLYASTANDLIYWLRDN